MAPVRHAPPLALSLSLLLAGCTFFGESTDVDKSDYDGGVGFALVVDNAAKDPFQVVVRVLGVGNVELGRIEETLEPGDHVEKWWSLKDRSTYSARLEYTWNGANGGSSHGFDDQTFGAQECAVVSRLAWELVQDNNTVGHRFNGKTCVTDED